MDVSVGFSGGQRVVRPLCGPGSAVMARQIVPPERGLAVGRGARPADPGRAVSAPRVGVAGRDGAGSAHGALLRAGRIPDPFYGMNEQAQWVGDKTWVWRLRFRADADFDPHEDLLFRASIPIATSG